MTSRPAMTLHTFCSTVGTDPNVRADLHVAADLSASAKVTADAPKRDREGGQVGPYTCTVRRMTIRSTFNA